MIATRAPSAARPVAVALPIPPVPPVTRTVRPAIARALGHGGASSLDPGRQRTILKLNIGVPSAPISRSQIGSSISVPRAVREVAEVDHVGVPEALQQVDHRLLGVVVVARHEDGVVAAGGEAAGRP